MAQYTKDIKDRYGNKYNPKLGDILKKVIPEKFNVFPDDTQMFEEFARYQYRPRAGDRMENEFNPGKMEALLRELQSMDPDHGRQYLERLFMQGNVTGREAEALMARRNRSTYAHQDSQLERLKRMLEREGGTRFNEMKIDPNSIEGIQALEREAERSGISRPYKLCMTQRTWHEFIDGDAKEYITQQMDAGELTVEISTEAPDKAIIIMENSQ